MMSCVIIFYAGVLLSTSTLSNQSILESSRTLQFCAKCCDHFCAEMLCASSSFCWITLLCRKKHFFRQSFPVFEEPQERYQTNDKTEYSVYCIAQTRAQHAVWIIPRIEHLALTTQKWRVHRDLPEQPHVLALCPVATLAWRLHRYLHLRGARCRTFGQTCGLRSVH